MAVFDPFQVAPIKVLKAGPNSGWDESKHPRDPGGTETGGQFTAGHAVATRSPTPSAFASPRSSSSPSPSSLHPHVSSASHPAQRAAEHAFRDPSARYPHPDQTSLPTHSPHPHQALLDNVADTPGFTRDEILSHAPFDQNPSAMAARAKFVEETLKTHAADAVHEAHRSPTFDSESDKGGTWSPSYWDKPTLIAMNAIIDSQAAKFANIPADRKSIILGGTGGAGKSTLIRKQATATNSPLAHLGLTFDPDGNVSNYATVNPDDIKALPAFAQFIPDIPGLLPGEAGVLAHEASSYIANRLALRLMAQGKNILFDQTMANLTTVQEKVARMSDRAGPQYESPVAIFVDVPIDQSVKAAKTRWAKGVALVAAGGKSTGLDARFVQESYIRAAADPTGRFNSKNRGFFEEAKPMFSEWYVFDNTDFKGEMVGHGTNANPTRWVPTNPPPEQRERTGNHLDQAGRTRVRKMLVLDPFARADALTRTLAR